MKHNKNKTLQDVVTINLPLKKLQLIAQYYEFPLAIFFAPTKELKKRMHKKTRTNQLLKAQQKIEKIQQIIEEEQE